MILAIGDSDPGQQQYVDATVIWFKNTVKENTVASLLALKPTRTGQGQVVVPKPKPTEPIYLVGHGSPTTVGKLDKYKLAEALMTRDFTGAKYSTLTLCACNTGATFGNEAAELPALLAKHLNIEVLAPRGVTLVFAETESFKVIVAKSYDVFVGTPTEWNSLSPLERKKRIVPFANSLVSYAAGTGEQGYIPPRIDW